MGQGQLLPGDERFRGRPDLPALERGRPAGYRRGWQVAERVQGVLLVVLGLAGLAGVAAFPKLEASVFPLPIVCLLPVVALGGVGVILVGLRRIVDP